MEYELLNTGDRILTITNEFLAIEQSNGTVVLYPIAIKDNKIFLNTESVTIIGYAQEDDSANTEEYVSENGVHIINF